MSGMMERARYGENRRRAIAPERALPGAACRKHTALRP
jgi:hypothetical protein